MFVFDVVRELAHGLKLGARHSVDLRQDFVGKAMRPSVSDAMKNSSVGNDQAGR